VKRLLLVVPAVLVAGCGTPLTSANLGPSFRSAFTGLYDQQQRLLGRDALGDVQALVSCRRTGTGADGPGEDWVCSVQYTDLGTASAQLFEVQLKPDGCWKAVGPPATQPSELVDPITQRSLTNPLSEFDGCLDTSW